MQTPLQIAFHHVKDTEEIRALVEEKAAWLERFYDRITGCQVFVEGPVAASGRCNPSRVRILLAAPRGEIVVNCEPPRGDEPRSLAVIVLDAFDVARRRLEEHTGKKVNRTRKQSIS